MLRCVSFVTATALVLAGAAFATPSVAAADDGVYRGEAPLFMLPDELDWQPIASMAAPAEIAVIEGDLSQEEPFTFRLRMPADYRVEPHIHPAYERVTVLEGTFHFAHGETFDREQTTALPQGGVAIMPPGDAMFGYTDEPTVIQLHGTGPWGIDYIDPADDPRS